MHTSTWLTPSLHTDLLKCSIPLSVLILLCRTYLMFVNYPSPPTIMSAYEGKKRFVYFVNCSVSSALGIGWYISNPLIIIYY